MHRLPVRCCLIPVCTVLINKIEVSGTNSGGCGLADFAPSLENLWRSQFNLKRFSHTENIRESEY